MSRSTNPVVSIITPAYNHEDFISQCIDSVRTQTFRDWEMIIVDDGSTDRTEAICLDYQAKDARIRYQRQPNQGIFRLAETYNKALSMARGKYVAVLEGDDYWMPDKLQLQVDALEADAGIVMCWGKAEARVTGTNALDKVHPQCVDKHFRFYFNDPPGSIFNAVFDNFFPPLTYVIRRAPLDAIGGFIQTLPFPAVDLSTVLRLSLEGRFHYIDAVLGVWRLNPNQATKTYSFDIVEGSKVILLGHFDALEKKGILNVWFDRAYIHQYHNRLIIVAYSRMGRFNLVKKQYGVARSYYWKSIVHGGLIEPIWKLRSIVGLLFSFFRMDVEGLARMLGKTSYTVDKK